MYLIRRRAWRAVGPLRTGRGETDLQTDLQTERGREIDCLVAMGMKALCSYLTAI